MERASEQARATVRAVKNLKRWGAYATAHYLFKRGVKADMFGAALDFERRRKQ